jgi:arylsulfatase A-like enzyme
MLRREFLATAPLILARAGAAVPKQNVLFIAIDDLNDWVGSLGGHPQSQTPNLDKFAASGVNFTSAHCAAPLCNPSRAALMTGLRPSTTGVYQNNQPFRLSERGKDAVTLTQHLRTFGYKPVGSGKIYHGGFSDPQSWDDYYPDNKGHDVPKSPVPPEAKLPLNGIPRTAHFDWGGIDDADEDMGDFQVAKWVSQQLGKRHSDPMFIACGMTRPHLPWYVPKKYFETFPLDSIQLPASKNDDLSDVPEAGIRMAKPEGDHAKVVEYGQWKKAVQAYLASIAFCDAMLGHVFRALETSPKAANTAVVLWSDHGWHLGEKLHWRKFSLWERSTRNLLMMNIPGVTKPGGRCARTVTLLDIYPTMVEALGAPPRKDLDGQSLMPLLRDPGAQRKEPAITTFGRANHTVRTERWRYIRYRDQSEELYDHASDPNEWNNIAGDPKQSTVKTEISKWLPSKDAPDSPSARARAFNGQGERRPR